MVLPGAFRESLARRRPTGIKMLFQHEPDQPIGIWQHLAEDARGLYVRGRLMLDIARGREIHSLMRAGAVDGLSIGFRAVKARRDRISGVRRLEKIDLWEISVVTFPMLPEARVAVKARCQQQRVRTLAHARWSRARRDARYWARARLAAVAGALLRSTQCDGRIRTLIKDMTHRTTPIETKGALRSRLRLRRHHARLRGVQGRQ